MLLYAIFRNNEKVMDEKKLPEQMKTIVVLSKLGASEVHPVAIDTTNTNNTKEDKKKEQPDDDDHKCLEDSRELHLDECPV